MECGTSFRVRATINRMKNPYIIPAAMICASILAGFWMLKPPSEQPQKVTIDASPKAPAISIHDAAGGGNIEAVKQHLAAGTDVNAKDKGGGTPLHFAATKEIAELLIAKGADVNAKDEDGWTPLDLANRIGRPETADLIRKHGGKNGTEDYSIHLAAARGNIEAVKQHLAAGADVNAIDDDWGMTPLILAADDAHIKVAELLIANGADLNSKSRSVSMTSLHAAACDNQKEITALLIVKGADINAKDSNGKTPLNYAEEEKNTDLATLLRKHGGKTSDELKAAGN